MANKAQVEMFPVLLLGVQGWETGYSQLANRLPSFPDPPTEPSPSFQSIAVCFGATGKEIVRVPGSIPGFSTNVKF